MAHKPKMGVDTPHRDYTKYLEQWIKLQDASDGQEAVHAKTTDYLPKLGGQDDDDYKAYLSRALFYGATGRTIDSLTGMIFRKPPKMKLPKVVEDFSNNITLDGLSLQEFAEEIVDNDITLGRAGILVDHPDMADTSMTRAEAERQNIRPFLKRYTAMSIFNWKVRGVANSQILVEVRLWESVEEPGAQEFESIDIKQIRVLDINESGQYRQRIFRKPNDKDEWTQFGPDIIPVLNNTPLTFIPFIFVGVKNSSADVEKPPLIDLANVNFSHYKTTADLEHGAHFTGLPTAVITGAPINTDPETGEPSGGGGFKIGSMTAWQFDNVDANAFFLEFKGDGLKSLEKRIEVKEQYMATLGARMLAPDKRAAETIETVQIHRLGESSVLASIVQSISASLEKALKIFAMWLGSDEEVEYQLNRDFLAIVMSPQQLQALVQTWQAGGIAFVDLLDNLKRGEIVAENRSEDDIRSEIEQENPFKEEDLIDER